MTITAGPAVDAGGYDVEQVRTFIAQGREAAGTALGDANRLFDASRARPLAITLRENLIKPGVFFEAVLVERSRFERETAFTRRDVLQADWAAYAAKTSARVDELVRTINTQVEEVSTFLHDEALPVSGDPASVLVARGEVEAALQVDASFSALAALAAGGGDVAAAAASDWGRLQLIRYAGDDTGFRIVEDAAIDATFATADESRRRAAMVLKAMRTPRAGEKVSSISEAVTMASFTVGVVKEMLEIGFVIGRSRA